MAIVELTPGLHTIDIEYYNGGGGAGMFAQWDPTAAANFVDIPNSAFVHPERQHLTKTGTGTLTFLNTDTYSGPTTVSTGTLNVGGSIAASSGVSVASGATLSGSGRCPPPR